MRTKKARPAEEVRFTTYAARMTPAYLAWLRGLARHMRMQIADVFDHAMLDAASKSGYQEPAPPRL